MTTPKTRTASFCGITVPKRWAWTHERHAEEEASIRALCRPMGNIPLKPLPGDDVDKQGRLIQKRIGP